MEGWPAAGLSEGDREKNELKEMIFSFASDFDLPGLALELTPLSGTIDSSMDGGGYCTW